MLNSNDKYHKLGIGQADKNSSILNSKNLVKEVIDIFKPHLKSCEMYEPDDSLRINGAPAVKVNDNLVIAPDIKCITKDCRVFWIEVKDKAQRVYFPDTGADLHQVLGWYDINYYLNEPVLVIFKDPDYQKCLPKTGVDNNVEMRFQQRWNKFSGDFYGNWLAKLIKINISQKYPCIFKEKSRFLDMEILYFHIDNMLKITRNEERIIKDMDMENLNEIKAYKRNTDKTKTIIDEKEIRNLAIH